MRFVVLLLIALSFSWDGIAQLPESEKKLNADFELLLQAQSDSVKLSLCNKIETSFANILLQEESFTYPFASLKRMGKLVSPDSKFRIYNWNCVFSDGSYRYFGIVQYHSKEGLRLKRLIDTTSADLFTSYSCDNWPGALYYQIIPTKWKGAKNYILLGWDGNNMTSNKKLIEVLSFEKNGIQFGKPIISWRGKMLHRVVFEYAKQARMSIQYKEKKHELIFDHLAPSSPNYQNQFEYYGPDFSHDALVFEKGKWILKENIDFRKD